MRAQLLVREVQGHGADPLHLEEMEQIQCQMEIRHRRRLVTKIENVQVISSKYFALILLVGPLSGDRSQNLIRNPITPEESNSLFEQKCAKKPQ